MARIIAVANQKGGVGKTTSTLNLGAALQEQGQAVLLVDLDPQASLTMSVGLNPEALSQTIYNVLAAAINEDSAPTLGEVIVASPAGIEIAPANIELSGAELDLNKATMGEIVLREVLHTVSARYDFILIDCPPSLGLLTINALSAANQVLIPLQADYLALKGVNLLMKTISTIQRKINRELEIGGVFATMVDTRTLHAREVLSSVDKVLAGHVPIYSSVIKMNVRLKEAPISGESILRYASDSNVAQAYRDLAREVLNGR